jgi:hypothetical protein
MSRHYWSGISRDERIKAISDIHAIIDKYAIILNFQRFSDISLSLVLELDESDPGAFKTELSTIIQLDDTREDKTPEKNVIIYLNVSFTEGTGDLTIEVPHIPG